MGLCSPGRDIRCELPGAVRRTLTMSLHESTHGRRHDSAGGGNTDVSAIAGGERTPLRRRADSPHPSGHGIRKESEEATSDVGNENQNGRASGRSDDRQLRQTSVQGDSVTPKTDAQNQTDGSAVHSRNQCAEMQSRIGRQPNDEPGSYTGCSLSEIAASRVPGPSEPDDSGDRAETDPCVTQASGYLANTR